MILTNSNHNQNFCMHNKMTYSLFWY